ETVLSKVTILNHYGDVKAPNGFQPEISSRSREFTLQNKRVTASFSELGLLKALKLGKKTIPVHLDFAKYGVGVRLNSERSGAYLFLPDGDAVPLEIENTVVNIIEGPLFSSVLVQLPYIQHSAIIYNTQGADGLGIELHNLVDITKTNNFELVMRLSTNINNTDEFFTDNNGFQIIRAVLTHELIVPVPQFAKSAQKEGWTVQSEEMRGTDFSVEPLTRESNREMAPSRVARGTRDKLTLRRVSEKRE
uniref:Alpha-mannosidase 2-like n=1 Tax=Diabrotica virgifera virgifera TaxID=50390 RepID=A0A6P7GXH5_DIAVI